MDEFGAVDYSNTDEFDFSKDTPIEIPVIGPDGSKWTLKEASAKATKERRNIMSRALIVQNGQVVGMGAVADVEYKFVAACLWDEKGRNPSGTRVEGWGSQCVSKLYDKALEISNIQDDPVIVTQMKEALELPSTLLDLDTFVEWVKGLPDKFSKIKKLFGDLNEIDEDTAKN